MLKSTSIISTSVLLMCIKYVGFVFLILFLTWLLVLCINHKIKNIDSLLEEEKRFWKKAFLIALKKAVPFLATAVAFSVLGELVASDYKIQDNWCVILAKISTIITCMILLLHLAKNLPHYFLKVMNGGMGSENINKGTADMISKIATLLIFLISSLVALQTMGISLQAVWTLGGISGVAVGIASKELLSSVLSTVSIYIDKPFIVGEMISLNVGGQSILGIVEKIDWRLTSIRALDQRIIYIPNSNFAGLVVENISRMSRRRVVINLTFERTVGRDINIDEKFLLIADQISRVKHFCHDETVRIDAIKATVNELDFKIVFYLDKTVDCKNLPGIRKDMTEILWNILYPVGIQFKVSVEI